jgi:hypothetical protein
MSPPSQGHYGESGNRVSQRPERVNAAVTIGPAMPKSDNPSRPAGGRAGRARDSSHDLGNTVDDPSVRGPHMPRPYHAIVIASAVLLLAPQRAVAYEIGVRSGLSIARLYDSVGPAKEKSLVGFAGGLFMGRRLSDVWTARVELLYVTKGTSLGESETTDPSGNPIGTFETLHVLDYLEVPLLFSAFVPPTGPVSIGLVIGPSVGFELSERIKTTGSVEQSTDVDQLKGVDPCVAVGLALGLRQGQGRWSLEVRYTTGLTTLERPGDIHENTRTGTTMITLGYAHSTP